MLGILFEKWRNPYFFHASGKTNWFLRYVTKVTQNGNKNFYIRSMKFKNYIALVLAIIIFAKFIAIDSRLLGAVFNSNQITLVKTSCKFNGFSSSNFPDTLSESPSGHIISLHSFCNSFFDFKLEKCTLESEEFNFHRFNSPLAGLHAIFDNRISPPPKV